MMSETTTIHWNYGTITGKPSELLQFFTAMADTGEFSWPWQRTKPPSVDIGVKYLSHMFEEIELKLNVFPSEKVVIELISINRLRELRKGATHKLNRRFPAWINLEEGIIYIVVSKVTKPMVRHELGHFIIESALNTKLNYKAHEHIAQWCEL